MNVVDAMSAADILEGLPNRIHEVVVRHVAERPDHRAFVEDATSWSYRQFADAVDAVTADFVRLGIGAGDRVLAASENCVALAAFVFACSRHDAWAIIANPRLSPRELDQIVAHSGARRILLTSEVSKEAADHAARLRAERRQAGPFAAIAVGALNEMAVPEPAEGEASRQVAVLMHTSGTTGQPKAVMLSHRNVLFAARTSILLRQTAPGDRVHAVLPMLHIVGFSILLIATLMGGATAHLVAKYDPVALAKALAEDGITDLFGVPATYRRLLEYKAVRGIGRLQPGRLRCMRVAGAPLDLGLKARAEAEFGQPLLNNYGITECSPGLSGMRAHRPRNDESVGPGIEHRLFDFQGTPVPDGEVGELHVRGPNVMLGYYRAPELTAKAIDSDGRFNTGDLARLDGDHLFIVGCAKELIIRSGFNVYPAEVEAVLNSHKMVVQEEVVAFVKVLPGVAITAKDLMEYAGRHLTPYKRPCEIVLLESLPAASTGKVLKHRLWEAARAAKSAADAPPTPLRTSG